MTAARPSDYPDLAHSLAQQDIDSISLNLEAVFKTTKMVLERKPALAR